jgi:hypothetical protein
MGFEKFFGGSADQQTAPTHVSQKASFLRDNLKTSFTQNSDDPTLAELTLLINCPERKMDYRLSALAMREPYEVCAEL